jgi:hypothetical protein
MFSGKMEKQLKALVLMKKILKNNHKDKNKPYKKNKVIKDK